MLASYLIDATKSSQELEPTVLEQLGYKALTQEEVCGKGVKALPFAQVPVEGLLDFAGERADLALQLADTLAPMLVAQELEGVYRDLELPLVPILADIEKAGIRVDGRALASQATLVDRELSERSTRDLRDGGRRVQHQLAEAARRNPVRQAEAAGPEAHRHVAGAVDRGRSARGAGARRTTCRA